VAEILDLQAVRDAGGGNARRIGGANVTQTLFVDKSTGTLADQLLAYGLAVQGGSS
jgi:hypothetical protein